jgi:hypothetical protein
MIRESWYKSYKVAGFGAQDLGIMVKLTKLHGARRALVDSPFKTRATTRSRKSSE